MTSGFFFWAVGGPLDAKVDTTRGLSRKNFKLSKQKGRLYLSLSWAQSRRSQLKVASKGSFGTDFAPPGKWGNNDSYQARLRLIISSI